MMSNRTRRRRRSLEQWRQLIEAHATSGQTVTAFCAAHDLGKSTFQRWRNRLAPDTTSAVAPEPSTPAMFTPLLAEQTSAVATSERGWDIELDLGDGICLRLRRPT